MDKKYWRISLNTDKFSGFSEKAAKFGLAIAANEIVLKKHKTDSRSPAKKGLNLVWH